VVVPLKACGWHYTGTMLGQLCSVTSSVTEKCQPSGHEYISFMWEGSSPDDLFVRTDMRNSPSESAKILCVGGDMDSSLTVTYIELV